MKNNNKTLPDPPNLGKREKHFYDLLLFLLQDTSSFREGDTLGLAVLARAFHDHREATRVMDKEGKYYETGTGLKKLHPAYGVQKQAEQTIKDYSDRFGLNPKTRDKILKFDLKDEPDRLDLLDMI